MSDNYLIKIIVAVFFGLSILWLLLDYLIKSYIQKKNKKQKTNHFKNMHDLHPTSKYNLNNKNKSNTAELAHKQKTKPAVKMSSSNKATNNGTDNINHANQNTISLNSIGGTHTIDAPKNNLLDQEQKNRYNSMQQQERRKALSHMVTASRSAIREASIKYEIMPRKYNKDDLIAIFVKASQGELFVGTQIKKLLEKHNLLAGDRKIFHKHHKDDKGNYRLAFSVANGVGDGKLIAYALPDLQTRSIVFIIWAKSYKPLKYFDELIAIAHDFAKNLDGKLYTTNKELWTDQTTNRYREIIREKLAIFHKQAANKKSATT